jgi:hypothetical protein
MHTRGALQGLAMGTGEAATAGDGGRGQKPRPARPTPHAPLTHRERARVRVRVWLCAVQERHAEAAQYNFFPLTYVVPSEYRMFVEEFKRRWLSHSVVVE